MTTPPEHELDAPHPPPRPHRDSFRFFCVLVASVALIATVLYAVVRAIASYLSS